MNHHVIASNRRPHNYNVGEALEPDDWFDAHVVWELQAADLSKSRLDHFTIITKYPSFFSCLV
jgi:hypothetical protein